MTSPLDNQLLAMLPAEDFSALNRNFTTVELRQGESLAQPGDEIRKVYFRTVESFSSSNLPTVT
jgi:hypothetical protein